MALPSFTITVDGLSRITHYRTPGGSPKNAVIWLHGGTLQSQQAEPGQFLVETMVPSEADHIDFGPRGLLNGEASPAWVWAIPGTEGASWYPSSAPSANTDRNFVDALCDYIFANFPSVQKVFVASFSLGAMLTWHLYASNQTHAEQLSGYFLIGCGTPTLGGYNWRGMSKTARHACLWNGANDTWSQTEAQAKSWADSKVDLYETAGYTADASPSSSGTCDGHAVQRAIWESKPVRVRRFVAAGMGHVWPVCAAGRAILTYKQWGAWAL